MNTSTLREEDIMTENRVCPKCKGVMKLEDSGFNVDGSVARKSWVCISCKHIIDQCWNCGNDMHTKVEGDSDVTECENCGYSFATTHYEQCPKCGKNLNPKEEGLYLINHCQNCGYKEILQQRICHGCFESFLNEKLENGKHFGYCDNCGYKTEI